MDGFVRAFLRSRVEPWLDDHHPRQSALSLFGTIAQPDAGVMSGGGFELLGGFIGGGGGPPACYADCNLSGTITVADFGCFQTKFVVGDLYADCNQSGTLTVADFGCFQTKFVVGCP